MTTRGHSGHLPLTINAMLAQLVIHAYGIAERVHCRFSVFLGLDHAHPLLLPITPAMRHSLV